MFKRITSLVLVVAMLAGCASDASIARLGQLQSACTVGNQKACQLIPVQQQINHDEATSNGWKAVGIALLVPLLVLGAAAAASADPGPSCYWNRWGHYVCY
jgi:hypothetical protein